MYKIAFVGCGGISTAWFSAILARDDCFIAALVDVNIAAAEEKKELHKLNSKVFDNLEAALKDCEIDLVIDNTPPAFHHKTVTTALLSGCDVFGEKPMTDSLATAYDLVEVSKRTGKNYFVMQNRRYIPQIIAFKDFLQSGKLGGVGQLSADFHIGAHFGGFRDEMNSPLVADMAIHTFDAARFILGKNPKSVYCREFNPPWSWYKGAASAICVFEMDDGTIFDYRGSWCSNGFNGSWESAWRAECELGSARWDGGDVLEYEVITDINAESFIKPVTKEIITPIPMEVTGHTACINDMFSALTGGRKAQTDCADNIYSIEMVYNAIESAISGKPINYGR